MDFSTDSKYLERADSTAMSDIIFNLLIFFLLSSTFIVQSGIEIDLPRVVAPVPVDLKQVVVTLRNDGEFFINDQPVQWSDVEPALRAAVERAEDKVVVIRADQQAVFGRVVEIIETARKIGATGLAVATQPKKSETP